MKLYNLPISSRYVSTRGFSFGHAANMITGRGLDMGLFGRKSSGNRCPECRFYVMLEGYGFCSKDVPSNVNVRMLSREGIKRQCVRCPEEMTCGSWVPK